MSSLKDSWKQTGTGLGHAFRDLGKSIAKTAVVGTRKVGEWADEDENTEQKKDDPNVVETEGTVEPDKNDNK